MTAAEVHARENGPEAPLIVDVRPSEEYKSGHIAGAVNIPYTHIGKHVDELANEDTVVLYCTLGHRTKAAERTLLGHDLANVFHLDGGLGAWRQAGYPIHTGWGP
jgi:rhodanese-related sulfurtransferase